MMAQGMSYRDSLRSLITDAHSDSLRIRLYTQIAYDMRFDSAESGLTYAVTAHRMAENSQDPDQIALANKHLGYALEYAAQPEESLPLLLETRNSYLSWGDLATAAEIELHIARVWEDLGRMDMIPEALHTAIAYYDSVENHRESAYAHNFLGLTYWNLGDFAEAEFHYKRSHFHRNQYPATIGRGHVLNNLGVLYYNWSRYDDALEYYRRALDQYALLGEQNLAALVQSNMGEVYNILGQDSLARVTLLAARQRGVELQNEKVVVNADNWLGLLYSESGEFEKAEDHFRQFLEYQERMKDHSGIAKAYNHLGELSLKQENYPEAQQHYNNALIHALQAKNKLEEARSRERLGRTLVFMGEQEEAVKYLDLAISIVDSEGYPDVAEEILYTCGYLEFMRGNPGAAQRYLEEAQTKRDSIFNRSMQKRISELQTRFQIEEKDYEIALLKKESEIQDINLRRAVMVRHFFLTGIFILITATLITFRQYRLQLNARKLIEKQSAKLEELNQKLEGSIAERDRLFKILAHDLRGPLGSFTELLQTVNSMPDLETAELQEILKTMNTSARGLYRLTENLLKWAQVQTGNLDRQPRQFSLNELFREIEGIYQPMAENKSITLSISAEDGLEVYADWDMTYAVLRNLVSNAVKFTNMDGEITVTAESQGADMVNIKVSDSGIGIPEDALKNLFDPSTVLRRTGTNDEPSTGLGLVLVKTFVEENAGSISASSEVGKGSVFSISLPRQST